MKNRTLSLITVIPCILVMLVAAVNSAPLPAADKSLIKEAGIPIFSGAMFVNGNQDAGFRFATSISPEDVRAWYEKALPEWTLYNEYGGWILYKGKPGLGLGDLLGRTQVSVQGNPRLSEWFGLDKSMSTEIVIMVPR